MTVTDLHQLRASAVPAVPKEISASQRLAALGFAQSCEDLHARLVNSPLISRGEAQLLVRSIDRAATLLRELAK